MTSIRILCASLLLATATTPALAHAKDSADERAIRQTLARYESALNAADTDTIVSLYTEQGVQMAPDAPAAVGREAVRAAYDGTFKAISLNLKFTVDEVKMLGKDRALLRSHSNGTLKVNGSGQPAGPAAFKELFILSKQKSGEWKFSHYSFSAAPASAGSKS
ncbi:hypothetical protein CYFUS_001550 [Cystobacter fuscus]|uniref:SnoaL-like domain-containing protein n=1 Tax=Cystobacter fuscus TaxID=43 RepID=A0A250IYZ7_9BACT|nr:SgcJ/EcaC family oxidoreductase [Cystobacter fuscus]ATB36136.1 hypothetical protein CYFUS_001550 [Cystobacter fuscus]